MVKNKYKVRNNAISHVSHNENINFVKMYLYQSLLLQSFVVFDSHLHVYHFSLLFFRKWSLTKLGK